MKKTLLIFLLLVSTFLSAQNWMPFNPNDSVAHFVADDSIQVMTNTGYGSPRFINPINSVVLDTSITINNTTHYVFKKGFSFLKIRDFSTFHITNQLPLSKIKGRILGDTLIAYSDSTIIYSSDTLGFTLNFPHNYILQDTIQLGVSNLYTLSGVVTRKDTLTVNAIGLDSIAEVSMNVYNLLGQLDTSHALNNSKCIISKNNGIIYTVDFTSLGHQRNYSLLDHTMEIPIDSNYQMTTGDELFSVNALFDYYDPNNSRGFYLERKEITKDSLANGYRHLTISVQSNAIPFPISPYSFTVSPAQSYNVIVKSDSINYNFESSIIEFNQPSSIWGTPSPDVFAICKQLGKFRLVNLKSNDYRIPNFFFSQDSIEYFIFENSRDNLEIIGLNSYMDFNQYAGGCCPLRASSFLLYAKAGNKTWGTKPNIITSINSFEKDINAVYPNPTSNTLNITSSSIVDQIEIRDLNGKLVLQEPYSNQVDVSNLPSGVYLIQLIGDAVVSQKFIKN